MLTGVLCVQTLAGSVRAGDGGHMPVPEEYAGRITVYENGDFAYGYTADDVALDSEAMTLYVPGLINIFPEEELSRREKQAPGPAGGRHGGQRYLRRCEPFGRYMWRPRAMLPWRRPPRPCAEPTA